jgi:Spy/CpxP family protein refolding chaperone
MCRADEDTTVSVPVAMGNSQRPRISQERVTHMKKTAIALLLACVFAAPALFAQETNAASTAPNEAGRGAHMVQNRVAYLTTVLSLTSAQQTQVTTILTNAQANRSTAHTNLQNAIRSNDAAAMEQAANSIGTLAAQEALAHAKTEAAIYQVLAPDQQTKMAQLEAEGHHGERGFGPPPGH